MSFASGHVPPPFHGPMTTVRALANTATGGALGSNFTFVNKYKRSVFSSFSGGKHAQIVLETGAPTTFAAVWVGLCSPAGGIAFDGGQVQVTWGGAASLVAGSGVQAHESDIFPFNASWPPGRDLLIAFDVLAGGAQRYRTGLNTTSFLSYYRAGVQQAGLTTKIGTYTANQGWSRYMTSIRVSK